MAFRSYTTKATNMLTIDMFAPKTNIFVSICPGYDYQEGERRRLTPRHTWMLTVELTKYSLLGTQRKDPNPTHYSVVWNAEEDQYKLEKVSPSNFGIVGSILIQSNAPTSAQKLSDRLDAGFEVCPLSLDGSVGSDHWIRLVLYGLQQQKIVQDFDVDMFMTFSQAYLAKRMNGEGPARIAYSREHRDEIQKEERKKRFRLSLPQGPADQEESQKEKKNRFRMSMPLAPTTQDDLQKEKKKRFRMSMPPAPADQDHSQKEKKKRFRMSFPQARVQKDSSDVYGGLM